MNDLRSTFRPEFLNRIDQIVKFNPLTKTDLIKIVEIQIKEMENRLDEAGVKLEIDEKAKELLAKKGFDQAFGARPLKRVLQTEVLDGIARLMLDREGEKMLTVFVTGENGKIKVDLAN